MKSSKKESDLHPLHLKIRYRKREFLCYLNTILKNSSNDQLKVIIFAQGRTGSTLLESLLESTGHFKKHMEILSTRVNEPINPYQYLKGLVLRAYPLNFIFHLKIYHLTTDRKRPVDPEIFLNKLNRDGWKIIYLRRVNKVQHVLSNFVAESRGSYEKHNKDREKLKININCNRFVKMTKQRIVYSNLEEKILKSLPHLELEYERDLENSDIHSKTVNRVLEYLKLPLKEKPVFSSYKKVNKQSMEELIDNYDEFIDCLEHNNFQHYLT